VDSCTNSCDNFFVILFLWWVSVMKGKQQFTDDSSATVLQNTWKVMTLSVCCFTKHATSLTRCGLCVHRRMHLSSYLSTCQAASVEEWRLENGFPHACMHCYSPVLGPGLSFVKSFTNPGKLLGPVLTHGTWWQWEWGWDYFMMYHKYVT
jgi:hypothetical protein